MARGDRREEIFRDDRDRWKFLGYLAEGAERYRVKVYCYVLMENHFHLVVMTPEGNLSQWMHQLKTAYTVYFNRRHQVVGHLFQGRFKSTVIEAEKYLLEVSRYLHLNPVRGVVLGQERQWSAGNVCASTAGAATGVRRVGENEILLGQ